MTPEFKISADGKDISSTLTGRVISLTIQDEHGYESDTLTLELDDANNDIQMPRHGAMLKVELGYSPSLLGLMGFNQSTVTEMGEFTVDEVEVSGPPEIMRITARSADLRGNLKTIKTRSWHDVMLGDLVQSICAEHNLTAKVSIEFSSIKIKHIDQQNESDLNLLYRLATQYGAISKQIGTRFIFLKEGSKTTASGTPMDTTVIKKTDATRWSGLFPDRGNFQTVISYYTDKKLGKLIEVSVGTGDPTTRIKTPFATREEAEKAAASKLARVKQSECTVTITLPGNPSISAQTPVFLVGFREQLNGIWSTKSVTHTVTRSGYTTSVQLVTPS